MLKWQKKMMMNRSNFFIKAVIIYLTILSLLVSFALLTRINAIIGNLNLFFLCLLLIVLFISVTNVIFLFRKNSIKDYRLVILYNLIFSLISGYLVIS